MRILYIFHTDIAQNSGGCIRVREIANNLSLQGNKVILNAGCAAEKKAPDFLHSAIIFYRTGSLPSDVNIFRRIWQILKAMPLSFAYGLKERSNYDIIYIRDATEFEALAIKLFLRKPLVIEVHGGKPILDIVRGRSRLGLWLVRIANSLRVRYSDMFIAANPVVVSYLTKTRHVPESKVVLVENGANPEMFKPTDAGAVRLRIGLSPGDFVVGFAGVLTPWQGLDYLIQAAPLILARCPNTRFLIVGDGPSKSELLDMAEQIGVRERFVFTGSLPYEDVPSYINASDVCVVQKKLMGVGWSPLKMFEYMACAKPVVATKGLDILEKINAGLLVNPENAEEFADAVVKLLQNPELRKQMGDNGRRYATENCSWATAAKKISEVCEHVINRAKAREKY